MSTPSPYMSPGGYVPPAAPPRRSGPGCWLWGLLTCLVLVIIFVLLLVMALNSFLKSKNGQTARQSFQAIFNSVPKLETCDLKMKAARDAIIRYHEHTGTYPATLQTLVPAYLPGPSPLHCDLDTNTDPNHVTFKYYKPAPNAAGTTTLLSFPWNYSIPIGTQKTDSHITMIVRLNGQMVQQQTQTITVSAAMSKGASTPPPMQGAVVHKNADGSVSYTTTTTTVMSQ